jgi:hypothetical protein
MNKIYAVLAIKDIYLEHVQAFLAKRELGYLCRIADTITDYNAQHALNEFLEAPGFNKLFWNGNVPVSMVLDTGTVDILQEPVLAGNRLVFASHWPESVHSMVGFDYFIASLDAWTDAHAIVHQCALDNSMLYCQSAQPVNDAMIDILIPEVMRRR